MKGQNRGKIFISYRREGGQEIARLIHDHLSYRGYDVFLDTESLGGGTFNTVLLQRIQESSDFILILTPGALDRCASEADWVRQELACALANRVNIVPVPTKNFVFPRGSDLPSDIAEIVNYNGPTVNHEYFNAFVDKLENCLSASRLSDPSPDNTTPRKRDTAKRDAAKKRKKKSRLLGAIAAVLLLAVILLPLLLSRGNGLPPLSEKQTFGSSAGNLCNEGLGSATGAAAAGSANTTYIHSLEDRLYWYNAAKKSIMTSFGEEESTELLSDVTVGYLSVSTDWFYYTLEDAETTLYRARRLENGTLMGEPEELAAGISGDSDIIVEEEYAYYWRSGRGLCKLHLTKNGKETLLTPMEAIWQAQLLGKSADWIYGCDGESIWRINAISGDKETIFLARDHFTDRFISGGNAQGDWIYFVASDRGEDPFSHADRLYRVHTDGSAAEQLFVTEHADQALISVCVYDEHKLALTADQNGKRVFFRLNTQSGKVTERQASDFRFAEIPGVTVGNTLTNLSSSALLADNDEGKAVFLSSSLLRFYNRFADGDLFYYYNAANHSIRCGWKDDNGDSHSADFLTGVDCSYLCVTPDWLYYILAENGVSNLYRAENDVYTHTIGTPELLAGDIAGSNSAAVSDGWIYYWVKSEGLYRLSLSTGEASALYSLGEGKNCHTWHTFNVTDQELHFFTGNSLYRVSIGDGGLHYLLNGEGDHNDGVIVSAVANENAVYYAVQYPTSGKADEIWSMDYASGTSSLLCVMPSAEQQVESLNLTSQNCYIRISRGDTAELYRLPFFGGELTLVKAY